MRWCLRRGALFLFVGRAGGRRSDDQLKLVARIGAALRSRVIGRRVLPGVWLLRWPRRCQKDAWGRWLYRFRRGWECWLGLGRDTAGQQEGTKREGRSRIERGLHRGPSNRNHISNFTHRTIFQKVSDVAQRRISRSEARAPQHEQAEILRRQRPSPPRPETRRAIEVIGVVERFPRTAPSHGNDHHSRVRRRRRLPNR